MSVSCNIYFIFKSFMLLALSLFSLSYGLIIFMIESYVRDSRRTFLFHKHRALPYVVESVRTPILSWSEAIGK